jgi:hypothetical protein
MKHTDETENLSDENDNEDNEIDLFLNKHDSTVWRENGPKKDQVIHKLIKCFGSLVVRIELDSDNLLSTKELNKCIYRKAPNAAYNVLKARV